MGTSTALQGMDLRAWRGRVRQQHRIAFIRSQVQPFVCIGLASAFWMTASADARAIPAQDLPTIQQQQDDIQRRHEDELRRQEQQRREPLGAPPNGYAPPEVKQPVILEEGACKDIQAFDVQGASLMSAPVLTVFTAEYQGRCLTLDHINALLSELSNWYLDRGYVTTRAYLPPQDLSTGTLTIVIVEGRTEDLSFRPEPDARGRLNAAFPDVKGEVLNIRDLEQGLDQINRLPSNDAKLKLEPGKGTGGTSVVIENTPAKRYRFTFTQDNTGSKSTGITQRTLGIEIDDALGWNDTWTLEFKPNQTGSEDHGSRTLSGSASIAYGYWTVGYSESWYTYVSTIQATTQSYESTGISRQRELTLERVVHRDQDSKTSVEAALTHKETRNFIAEELLETSSRKLSIGGVTLRHSNRIAGGSLNVSATVKRGLRMLGAKKDHQIASGDPRAQFKKISASASYSWPFQVGEQNLNASCSVNGQWTSHTLFGSERISAGGLSSVRGFKEQSITGDVGGYARTELYWYLPKTDIADIDKLIGQVAPYAALDGGWIKSDAKEEQKGGRLSGWALGLRAYGDWVTLDFAWAEAITVPHFIERTGHEIYASLGFEF